MLIFAFSDIEKSNRLGTVEFGYGDDKVEFPAQMLFPSADISQLTTSFDVVHEFAKADNHFLESLKWFYKDVDNLCQPEFINEVVAETFVYELQDIFADLFQRTNLIEHALLFCRTNPQVFLSYPQLTEAGNREGDNASLTFNLNDYQIMTAISLISKLMVPAWCFIKKRLISHRYQYSTLEADQVLFELVNPIIRSSSLGIAYSRFKGNIIFKMVSQRFRFIDENYSKSRSSETVHKILGRNDSDVTDFRRIVAARIITSHMVKFNPFARLGGSTNIMVFLTDGILRTTETLITIMKGKQQ